MDSLYYLASDMELSWLVGDYFKVVTNKKKKIEGLPVYPPEYEDFAFNTNSCRLFEVGFMGSLYTWWNERVVDDCMLKD